jgi:copper ion binding protein
MIESEVWDVLNPTQLSPVMERVQSVSFIMNKLLAILSVCALSASLQGLVRAESSECSSCEKSKTAVGTEAKSECTAAQKTLTLKVGGAVCEASCGKLVTALTRIQGVSKAESCTQSQMTKVSYDAAKVSECSLMSAVKEAGYTVEGQQVSLPVEGMQCGGCSTKVGKVLTSLEGVISGSACHESKQATVMFHPEKVSQDKIVAAIQSTGFKVAVQ